MDRIEGIILDSDEGGYFLTLHGDFVDACEHYLGDDDAVTMTLKVDPWDLVTFAKQIEKTDDYYYLSGRVK